MKEKLPYQPLQNFHQKETKKTALITWCKGCANMV